MRIGVFISETSGARTSVEQLLANAGSAETRGFATAWVPHIPWSLDALSALTLAASVTDRIELGTAVVPTYPRHPLSMAQDALSVQAASKGRVTLGIGPSHPMVIEGMYGLSYARPVAHTSEYVEALRSCFAATPAHAEVRFEGEHYRIASMLEVPGSSPVPILVAALAPRMLEMAGRLADGTVTYWADEYAIGTHVVPAINAASDRAGRPTPRVVVGLPVAVVGDAERARQRAAKMFAVYNSIPAYQRILERSPRSDLAEVAIIGDEKAVGARIRALADAGATDLMASPLGLEEQRGGLDRTIELLADLA